MLSTLCIVCTLSYLYQYRPSNSYADLPIKQMQHMNINSSCVHFYFSGLNFGQVSHGRGNVVHLCAGCQCAALAHEFVGSRLHSQAGGVFNATQFLEER